MQGSIATFGTYSFAGTDLLIKVEHSTFPNWIGADQKRTITVTGDQLMSFDMKEDCNAEEAIHA